MTPLLFFLSNRRLLLLHLVGSGLLRLANTFAESNRASSSPQGLKILGDPMNDYSFIKSSITVAAL